ncbi:TnsA endonuclease N-terminal domain-containing protein [Alcaligenes sp. Lyrl_28]|uniref:TnsA endonuclease N-terminal domain-containing protein n=1 Tax=Alcaligenes sp. Lyrl_28 TaxID=3110924 RepID=UPI003F7B984D
MVAFESLIERDVILLLEFSRGVQSYQEQPERIVYSDGQAMRDYYPDFEARLTSGPRVHIEVKPSAKLDSPKIAKKLQQIATHYAQHRDEHFRVITELDARKEPLHSNLKTLSPLRAKPAASPQALPIGLHGKPWHALEASVGRDVLLKQVALGNLVCDLASPLQGDLMVFNAKEVAHDSLYL